MRPRIGWSFAFVAFALLGIWAMRRPHEPPADAHGAVASGARLVDVRTAEEFAEGHLPGAINLPVEELGSRWAELTPKDKPIVVYCSSGYRSREAAQSLAAHGFTAVFDLGPMSNW